MQYQQLGLKIFPKEEASHLFCVAPDLCHTAEMLAIIHQTAPWFQRLAETAQRGTQNN
jgi:hypothetical protein